MVNRFLDARKTLEVIIYISHKEHDLRRIMKYVYFADKCHVEKYGRFITSEVYIRMPQGPVPSAAYDIAKIVRDDDQYFDARLVKLTPKNSLRYEHPHKLIPLRNANLDYLSESDIECLDETISDLSKLTDKKLIDKGHKEKAWIDAQENGLMNEDEIILSVEHGKRVLAYMNSD